MPWELPIDSNVLESVPREPAEGLDPRLVDRLRLWVDRLPDRERDVVNGLLYEKVSVAVLMRRMGSAETPMHRETVLTIWHRALELLREDLRSDGVRRAASGRRGATKAAS